MTSLRAKNVGQNLMFNRESTGLRKSYKILLQNKVLQWIIHSKVFSRIICIKIQSQIWSDTKFMFSCIWSHLWVYKKSFGQSFLFTFLDNFYFSIFHFYFYFLHFFVVLFLIIFCFHFYSYNFFYMSIQNSTSLSLKEIIW